MPQDDKPLQLLLSPARAAQALDVSRSTIYNLMRSGAIGFVTIGADRRIPMSEVQRLAAVGSGKAAA